jgi:hypothetical protein
MHIAMHGFNTGAAVFRIVNGPAPVMAPSNSQRFAVRIRNKSSAEAKLIQVPNFLSNARCLTSSRVATYSVTVFILSASIYQPRSRNPAGTFLDH